jgi:hypothetical protein
MSSAVTRRLATSYPIFARATHTCSSFSSSMEVKVSAYRQSLSDHTISSLACQALLTMVAGARIHLCFIEHAPIGAALATSCTPTRPQFLHLVPNCQYPLLSLPLLCSFATSTQLASDEPIDYKCGSKNLQLNKIREMRMLARRCQLLLLKPLSPVELSWLAAVQA